MNHRILLCVIFLATTLSAMSSVPLLRVQETHPTTSAWVLAGQEQLSGQAFQQDALVSYNGFQYTVYYNATRNVTIARRRLFSGKWQEVVLPHRNTADDAHNVISIGFCRNDGTIHLAYDHHNTTLQYCRSVIGLAHRTEPDEWTASSFGPTTSALDQEVVVPDVTYPRFIEKPDGNLLLECRYRLSGDGDSYLREYDGVTHTWKLLGRYVQGMDARPDACAYINRMDYDTKGRLHVSWCWRDDFGGGSNHDLFYGYSLDDGRTWKDTHGKRVAITEYIRPTNSRFTGLCMRQGISSLKVADIPHFKGYINQETQATDSKGRVHIAVSYMEEGTDMNWASSRSKAVLHHWLRETNGTWRHTVVRHNGVPVHSPCRVQLVIDKLDNAFLIAGQAEVYAATAAGDYLDWSLVSDTDKGRFCSEPQVDRWLLKEGMLSFVYLERNGTIAVIDYLLDNPGPFNGKGLKTDYFYDENSQLSVKQVIRKQPGGTCPAGTRSVRWSGYLETAFAEPYTLHVTTSSNTVVIINDECVLETTPSTSPRTFSIPLRTINSHRNKLVIMCKGYGLDNVSLAWSSRRTHLSKVPTRHLFPL